MRGASGGLEPPSYRDIPHTICLLKVDALIYFVGMVRYHQFKSHAYRRILLSVSSRASNVPLRTLWYIVADCLLPHLLITGWLLTIYSTALI